MYGWLIRLTTTRTLAVLINSDAYDNNSHDDDDNDDDICESLMLIGNGRIGKIPETGKTGHKIGEIYKMGADIRDRGGRGGDK